ncbi:hypothetical protein [Dyella acidisoli]|uniref:DUF4131 domain-containing protein n=1 Tax=Dyella acidisoli TaxID=1867834 RepID=A0ABQ5XPA7_9GAMM|nr:hypothetical protein [Dyella acidisoli]GLQ92355.1 hypothetical protein GCM10007901_13060 [Dyella acidisoli]
MDAHVPQRQGVVRLSLTALRNRWPALALAIAWMVLLACLPWWAGLPLLLGLAAIQVARLPRLQPHNALLRRALRWGFAGLLVASYLAFDRHALGLTLTMLAALVGFSLLVLLESWQDRKPQRNAVLAATSPEWRDMALAQIGPADTLIELESPIWASLGESATDMTMIDMRNCRIGTNTHIHDIEPQVSMAPGQRWMAMPMTAWSGVVLYDRAHDKQYRLRGWQLYGWHAGEAWLSRGEDQPPLALSHVLGQDVFEER